MRRVKQTKEEKERSKKEQQDLVDRMRIQAPIDDRQIAEVFGTKPDQSVIQSCLSCNNKSFNRTEVCCWGLFKGRKEGRQWRCSPITPESFVVSKRATGYLIDNFGTKTFTASRGAGSNDTVCKNLGEQMAGQEWEGNVKTFNFLPENSKSCQSVTKICKA